jgi:hypothetical protein
MEEGQFDPTSLVLVTLDESQKVINIYVPETNGTTVVGAVETEPRGERDGAPFSPFWGVQWQIGCRRCLF